MSESLIYGVLAFAPWAIVIAATRTDEDAAIRIRSLAIAVLTPALAAALLALSIDSSVVSALTAGSLTATYLMVWAAMHWLLGQRRVAAVVVALFAPLLIGATFTANQIVESPPGSLVFDAAPQFLVHVNPVYAMARVIGDDVQVRHYFYHQAQALPPPATRVIALHLLIALALLASGWIKNRCWRAVQHRSSRASPDDPRHRSPASP